jgi:hypothetical protein
VTIEPKLLDELSRLFHAEAKEAHRRYMKWHFHPPLRKAFLDEANRLASIARTLHFRAKATRALSLIRGGDTLQSWRSTKRISGSQ